MKTYRQQQLENAQTELNKARGIWNNPKSSKKAKRGAAEDIEFWSNKTAFLTNVKFGVFEDER